MSSKKQIKSSFYAYDLDGVLPCDDQWREFLVIDGRVTQDSEDRKVHIKGCLDDTIRYNKNTVVQIMSYNKKNGDVEVSDVPMVDGQYDATPCLRRKEISWWHVHPSLGEKLKISIIENILMVEGKNHSPMQIDVPEIVQIPCGNNYIRRLSVRGIPDVKDSILKQLTEQHVLAEDIIKEMIIGHFSLGEKELVFSAFSVHLDWDSIDVIVSASGNKENELHAYCKYHLTDLTEMTAVFLIQRLLQMDNQKEIKLYMADYVN